MKMAPQRDNAWREACQAMQVRGDLKPLARLFISGSSPPPWVLQYLGRLFDPSTDCPQLTDPLAKPRADKTPDRLVFHRSSKSKTNQDKLAVGVWTLGRIRAGELRLNQYKFSAELSTAQQQEVLKLKKQARRTGVIKKARRKFGVKKSYVHDAIARAETLPPNFWDFARRTGKTVSPHRTGPRKKQQSTKT
jgi:hypothetical protein